MSILLTSNPISPKGLSRNQILFQIGLTTVDLVTLKCQINMFHWLEQSNLEFILKPFVLRKIRLIQSGWLEFVESNSQF